MKQSTISASHPAKLVYGRHFSSIVGTTQCRGVAPGWYLVENVVHGIALNCLRDGKWMLLQAVKFPTNGWEGKAPPSNSTPNATCGNCTAIKPLKSVLIAIYSEENYWLHFVSATKIIYIEITGCILGVDGESFQCPCSPSLELYLQDSRGVSASEMAYTWYAVTSVILNISMVRYSRRHLACTTDCLHEQEWWILMRWSFERSW